MIASSDLLDQADRHLRREPVLSLQFAEQVLAEPVLDMDVRIRALLLASRARLHLGAYEEGEHTARQALALARQSGRRRDEGMAQNETGVFRFVKTDLDGALGHYGAAEQLLKETGSEQELAKVYLNTGNVLQRQGNLYGAISYYEKTLGIAEHVNDDLLQAKVLMNMSSLYAYVVSDSDAAFQYTKRAVVLYEKLQDTIGMAKAYSNLSLHYIREGEPDEAIRLQKLSLNFRYDGGCEPEELLLSYFHMATAYLQKGDVTMARSTIAEARAIPGGTDSEQPGSRYMDVVESQVLIEEHRYHEALAMIQDVIAWCNRTKFNDHLIDAYLILAKAAAGASDYPLAIEAYKQLLEDRASRQWTDAQQSLVHLRAHFDFRQAEAQAEIERLRNVELAGAVRRLETLHAENSEYLAFMAHELKSPLNTIRAMAELMLGDNSGDDKERYNYAADIRNTVVRMHDHVNGVLSRASGRENEPVGVVDARVIWNHVLTPFYAEAHAKGITLYVLMDSTPLPVAVPERALISILENLVSNALKFSSSLTTVTVTVSINGPDVNTGQYRLLLSVNDQGPGLSSTDMVKLFLPFQPLGPSPAHGDSSSGIGLHIVRRDVESAGGRVWCESITGAGSTFFVELPLAAGAEGVVGSTLRESA